MIIIINEWQTYDLMCLGQDTEYCKLCLTERKLTLIEIQIYIEKRGLLNRTHVAFIVGNNR